MNKPTQNGYQRSQYKWKDHNILAQANLIKYSDILLKGDKTPLLSPHGYYYYKSLKVVQKSNKRLTGVATAEIRPIRPQRRFNRACRWCYKIFIAVSLFIFLAVLVYGYIKYQEYMTPKEYIVPTKVQDIRVFNKADLETLLKGEVDEIWDGEKFVPSGDFELVKQAEAKTEPVRIEDKIKARIYERFAPRGDDAIKMLRTCENGTLSPTRVSGMNRDGTVDVGLFQVNVDPKNKVEVEHLKDWEYNIERAGAKFDAKGKTFYFWTCGHVVGDYTYVDAIRARRKL